MKQPVNIAPEVWAQFAAAALAAVIQSRGELHGEGFRIRFAESSEEAAKYADALEAEYIQRFHQEVK